MEHLDLHHALPLYAGGTNTMGNLEVVCSSCHRKLHIQLRKIHPYSTEGKTVHTVKYINRADTVKDIRKVRRTLGVDKLRLMKSVGWSDTEIIQMANMLER